MTFYFRKSRLMLLIFVCISTLMSCEEGKSTQVKLPEKELNVISSISKADTVGQSILSKYHPPKDYSREMLPESSFQSYLRNFKLLPSFEKVHLYNGLLKRNQEVHDAILDIDVGNRDLQQCADAVMRLRSEYLYGQGKFEEIAFNFTNGWRCDYSNWRLGKELIIDGNRTFWGDTGTPRKSYKDFRSYLNMVFTYAGTLSLAKELIPINIEEIEIGDVFIFGGSPGHAIIVVDMVKNNRNGDKAFILAQSYMPAQQIHILKNLNNKAESPWYFLSEVKDVLDTPEWTFDRSQLKRFQH